MTARTRCSCAAALAFALVLTACGDAPTPAARQTGATTAPRATLVLEPPSMGVGQVALLELAVVTPPGSTARPYVPPEELPGLWVLGVERAPLEEQPERWVQRTRLRVRARGVGAFVWPAGQVEVEGPDGDVEVLPLPELSIEVASLLPEYPDQLTPFGPRDAPQDEVRGGSVWGPAAAGALAAFALMGLVALARRRRAATSAPQPEPAEPPWIATRAELAAARSLASTDPFQAAHVTSIELCRFVSRRFGADAVGRTSEELGTIEPPFATRSRWPALLAILRSLDELRFLPDEAPTRSALASRLGGLLDEADRFVDDSVPPEARR